MSEYKESMVDVGHGITFTSTHESTSSLSKFFNITAVAEEIVDALKSLGGVPDRGRSLSEIEEAMSDLHEGLVHDFPKGDIRFQPSYHIPVDRRILTVCELLQRFNNNEKFTKRDPFCVLLDGYSPPIINRQIMPRVAGKLASQAIAIKLEGSTPGDKRLYHPNQSAQAQAASLQERQENSCSDEACSTIEVTTSVADDILLAAIARGRGEILPYRYAKSRKIQMGTMLMGKVLHVPVVSSSLTDLKLFEQSGDPDPHIGITYALGLKEVPS